MSDRARLLLAPSFAKTFPPTSGRSLLHAGTRYRSISTTGTLTIMRRAPDPGRPGRAAPPDHQRSRRAR